ncbi:FAD:protein FMN transferase [Puniceicoccaceae bacterium K14]|nr:FAD:protein FMN transferase [Puniceicoccaceae bacterium K14]
MNSDSIVKIIGLKGFKRFEHDAMSTRFSLHLYSNSKEKIAAIAEEAFRLVDNLESKLSLYREGSDITRINRARAGDVLRLDEVTHNCLLSAFEVSAGTGGMFDPFVGSEAIKAKGQSIPRHLSDLQIPSQDENSPVIAIDPQNPFVTKLEGKRWLDLGAIGKGAALDTVYDLLKFWEVPAGVLVGGGSSVLVFGDSPQNEDKCWTLEIPILSGKPRLKYFGNFALGASGIGYQPNHIISRSGDLINEKAVVMAKSATVADALSTASLLLSDNQIENLGNHDSVLGIYTSNEMRVGTFKD